MTTRLVVSDTSPIRVLHHLAQVDAAPGVRIRNNRTSAPISANSRDFASSVAYPRVVFEREGKPVKV